MIYVQKNSEFKLSIDTFIFQKKLTMSSGFQLLFFGKIDEIKVLKI